MERVRREVGGVELARREAPEGVGHHVSGDAGGVERARALDELHHGTSRGLRGAAAERVESGLRHAVAVEPERDTDEIAAGRPAGRAGVGRSREPSPPAGGLEVIVEGCQQTSAFWTKWGRR